MSQKRLVYLSAIIGGGSAFLGWLISESLLNPGEVGGGRLSFVLTGAIVGSAINAGLSLVSRMANGHWKQQMYRVVPGLLAGGIGGAVGAFLGDILFTSLGLPRALGWMIMGAAIGIIEGLYERSPAKLRNGLIGGTIGGGIGGFLFHPILGLSVTSSGMIIRATAFIILGTCIGVLMGLVKVVFKDAWLTVLDGDRPGRQVTLSEAQTVLGRAEYVALPFLGRGDAELDMEHARVIRQPDGRFILEDNHSRQGTLVNNIRLYGRVLLKDGDVIMIGTNSIRFSERHSRANEAVTAPVAPAPRPMPPPVPLRPMPPVPPRPVKPAAPRPMPPEPLELTPEELRAISSGSPAAAPDGSIVCPSCHQPIPRPQRYCIRCDIYF